MVDINNDITLLVCDNDNDNDNVFIYFDTQTYMNNYVWELISIHSVSFRPY